MLRSFLSALAAFALVGIPVVGCSSAPDGASSGDEQDIIPQATKTVYDQAEVCSLILKRHAGVRDVDLRDGAIRWNCADVPGVTSTDLAKCSAKKKAVSDFKAQFSSGKKPTKADIDKFQALSEDANRECQGFGQEYCEYHAVAGGQEVKSLTAAGTTPFKCVFTSVFADARPTQDLAAAMADAKNLGAKAAPSIVQMQVGFNSNGAASALIRDCRSQANPDLQVIDDRGVKMRDRTAAEKAETKRALIDEARQAACWLASADGSKHDKLVKACRGKDLAQEKNFAPVAALGVKVAVEGDGDFQTQRDLAACLASKRAGGVIWRNSDNMICGRIVRAAEECSCDWNAIPDAFPGFILSGWTNDALPTGCRYAKVDGADYQNVVICEVSQGEQEDLAGTPGEADLQGFCHDRFSKDIVMKAPVRAALEKPGSCQTSTAYCTASEAPAAK